MPAEKTLHCDYCRKPFVAVRSTRKYCEDTCRIAAYRLRNLPQRVEKFSESSFFEWLVTQCKRAKTVEVLRGANLDKLLNIFNYAKAVGGYDEGKPMGVYSVCHISPVAGIGTVGLLHEDNLFVGSRERNQHHATTDYGRGLSIQLTELSIKWRIESSAGRAEVRSKIFEFIGLERINEFSTDHTFNKNTRFKLLDSLSDIENAEGETVYELTRLSSLATDSLIQIARQHGIQTSTYTKPPANELDVLSEELFRLRNQDAYHTEVVDRLLHTLNTHGFFASPWMASQDQQEVLAAAGFTYLSGGPLPPEAIAIIEECYVVTGGQSAWL